MTGHRGEKSLTIWPVVDVIRSVEEMSCHATRIE
jgi:hypothetical protein